MQRHVRHCFESFSFGGRNLRHGFQEKPAGKTGSTVHDSSANLGDVFVSGTAAVSVYSSVSVSLHAARRSTGNKWSAGRGETEMKRVKGCNHTHTHTLRNVLPISMFSVTAMPERHCTTATESWRWQSSLAGRRRHQRNTQSNPAVFKGSLNKKGNPTFDNSAHTGYRECLSTHEANWRTGFRT